MAIFALNGVVYANSEPIINMPFGGRKFVGRQIFMLFGEKYPARAFFTELGEKEILLKESAQGQEEFAVLPHKGKSIFNIRQFH